MQTLKNGNVCVGRSVRKFYTAIYIILFLITLALSCVIAVFSARFSTFSNPTSIYYTVSDINSGRTLNQAIKSSNSYTTENTNISRIVFDKYTDKSSLSYVEDGDNVIDGAIGSSLTWDNITVEIYRIENGDNTFTIYILSDQNIVCGGDMSYAFYNLRGVEEIVFNNFNLTNLTTNMTFIFGYCSSLQTLNLTGLDTSNVSNMSYMFWYCSGLTNLIIPIDTTSATTMQSMFGNCSSLTSLDVSTFNTSLVTNMGGTHGVVTTGNGYTDYGMFGGCSSLTSLNLSNFNTSNVTTMKFMFAYCNALETINLSGFNMSKVTDIEGMFAHCESITDESIATIKDWDVSSVIDMGSDTWLASGLFGDCQSLTTIDLSGWDTGSVTNMGGMFSSCSNLINIVLGENWDTSNVTDMGSMFTGCSSLTENGIDLSKFNTEKVTIFGEYGSTVAGNGIFQSCSSFVNVDLTGWSSASLTSVYCMFYQCTSLKSVTFDENFTCDLVTDYRGMFSGCSQIETIDISNFNTLNAEYLGGTLWSRNLGVFSDCLSLTNIIYGSGWDTSNVLNFSRLFRNCSSLTSIDLSIYNTSSATDTSYMFYGCSGLTNLDLQPLNTELVIDMSYMFYNCSGLTALDLFPLSTSQVSNMSYMFYGCSGLNSLDLEHLNTSQVTNMSYMFYNCSGLTTLDVEPLDTSLVTNMAFMFYNCIELEHIYGLDSFDTSLVTSFNQMFRNCSSLRELDLSSFYSPNLTDIYFMFAGCSSLTSIDISSFASRNLTRLQGIFSSCSNVTSINISNLGTSAVSTFGGMFMYCPQLTEIIGLTELNTSSGTSFAEMFRNTGLIELDLSNFDTSNVTNMNWMFTNATALKVIYVGNDWTTENVTSSTNMFAGVGLDNYNSSYSDKTLAFAGYDSELDMWGYLILKEN